ncbi:hypothetical protein G8759_26705 [Spirosoma aureum]|uniref:Uncharacterized protein n=1 Tax=Spirosoma aureum TaxID=2692134 RepID=A0A6G9AUG4_9BACT|nr:hypothetical protein [Spirosoma aureum]QIP15969.1 hypothetical protein G8759_26705 [Spirosoma aureum]
MTGVNAQQLLFKRWPLVTHPGLSGHNLLDTFIGLLPSVRGAIIGAKLESGLIIERESYRIRFINGLGINRTAVQPDDRENPAL